MSKLTLLIVILCLVGCIHMTREQERENLAFAWHRIQQTYGCLNMKCPRIVHEPNMKALGMYSYKSHIIFIKHYPDPYWDVIEQEMVKACEGIEWYKRMHEFEENKWEELR